MNWGKKQLCSLAIQHRTWWMLLIFSFIIFCQKRAASINTKQRVSCRFYNLHWGVDDNYKPQWVFFMLPRWHTLIWHTVCVLHYLLLVFFFLLSFLSISRHFSLNHPLFLCNLLQHICSLWLCSKKGPKKTNFSLTDLCSSFQTSVYHEVYDETDYKTWALQCWYKKYRSRGSTY